MTQRGRTRREGPEILCQQVHPVDGRVLPLRFFFCLSLSLSLFFRSRFQSRWVRQVLMMISGPSIQPTTVFIRVCVVFSPLLWIESALMGKRKRMREGFATVRRNEVLDRFFFRWCCCCWSNGCRTGGTVSFGARLGLNFMPNEMCAFAQVFFCLILFWNRTKRKKTDGQFVRFWKRKCSG